jgi:hypothetical protein
MLFFSDQNQTRLDPLGESTCPEACCLDDTLDWDGFLFGVSNMRKQRQGKENG